MWTTILAWVGSFLGGPFIKGALDAYKAKLASQDSATRAAADLAARELAVQQAEIQAQQQIKVAEVGHFWEPEKLFAYIMVIYFGKIIVWDKVLALGATDPITGDGATWAGMVFAFYLGKRGIENVARIIKR